MLDELKETVFEILETEDKENELINLQIEALYYETLSYLNRHELTERILYPVAFAIADEIKNRDDFRYDVQSYNEGDLSVTFSNNSPFFGRLDGFKIIRGIDDV